MHKEKLLTTTGMNMDTKLFQISESMSTEHDYCMKLKSGLFLDYNVSLVFE